MRNWSNQSISNASTRMLGNSSFHDTGQTGTESSELSTSPTTYRYNREGMKMPASELKVVEKEEEKYSRMFHEQKANIEYLHSAEDDKLAASVYGNRNIKSISSGNKSAKQQAVLRDNTTSGYNFDKWI